MSIKKVGQDGEYQHLSDKKKFYSPLFSVILTVNGFVDFLCKISKKLKRNKS